MKKKTEKIKGIKSPASLVPMTPTEDQISRFKSKINFEAENGCFEWTACKNKKGYGRCRSDCADGKMRLVFTHRLAYVVFEQTQPLDRVVRHRCGNRACCNPAHTKLGTHMDNFNDAIIDGTQGRGEDHRSSKLTWDAVNEIRRAYREKELNQRELGERFGVDSGNMSYIIHNKIWVDENYEPPDKLRPPLTNAEIKKIHKLRAGGKTLMQIVDAAGRDRSTVYRHLKK